MDLASNNLQRLICDKTQRNKQTQYCQLGAIITDTNNKRVKIATFTIFFWWNDSKASNKDFWA